MVTAGDRAEHDHEVERALQVSDFGDAAHCDQLVVRQPRSRRVALWLAPDPDVPPWRPPPTKNKAKVLPDEDPGG